MKSYGISASCFATSCACRRIVRTFARLAVAGLGAWALSASLARGEIPGNDLRADGAVPHWLLLGPFPNARTEDPAPPEHVTRQGFQADYLQALGGEPTAVLAADTTVASAAGPGGTVRAFTAAPDGQGVIDFQRLFPDQPEAVVYAFCQLRSEAAQPVHLFVGHDDCAKVWLNGELIHRAWRDDGHGFVRREHHFTGQLQPGLNRLLVKVENRGYAWCLQVEAFSAAAAAPVLDEIERARAARAALTALQNCRPQPAEAWGYVIPPGAFPSIVWSDPAAIRQTLGDFPLAVQWYNARLQPVERATEPGRYLGAVSGTAGDGRKVRRMVTVFCSDPRWMPWLETVRAYLTYPEHSGFDREAYEESRENVAPALGGFLLSRLAREETGAIIGAYWQELRADQELRSYETPDVVNADIQVALKRKLLGVDFPALAAPLRRTVPARVLHAGSAAEAGVTVDAADRLRAACRDWAEQGGEPFNVLVARHGVIVLHEAFGDCTVDQKHSVASITKAVAGLMFARFADQGLIGIDDPVGRYLPDFPVKGPKVLTMRQLFTHTCGLAGHGEWGGLGNVWLDNVVALSLDQLPVGEAHVYNGMGYDLAGKVMEIVAGQGIQRVIQEQLWLPLGIKGSSLSDLGYSATLNAEDIAKLGQLVLNQGSYGDLEYFRPETCARLLPVEVSRFYPGVTQEWGIGLAYRRTDRIRGNAHSGYILSKDIIGHGSATSCLFLIDLEHDLVIAQSRRQGGRDYDRHLRNFLETVAAVLSP